MNPISHTRRPRRNKKPSRVPDRRSDTIHFYSIYTNAHCSFARRSPQPANGVGEKEKQDEMGEESGHA